MFTYITRIHLNSKYPAWNWSHFRKRTAESCWTCLQEICSLPDSTRTSFWTWIVNSVCISLYNTKAKTLMEPIFNPCGESRWNPEGPISQIHSPHLHTGAPGIFSDLLRSVQMLKRELGAESNWMPLHLYIPSKTATLVPEFVVEDLPLGRTAALVPEFPVKDLPMGRTHWWTAKARNKSSTCKSVDPGGPVVITLSSGFEVRGFDPGRGRWIFSESKNPEYDFLWKGSKAVGPVS